MMRKNGFSLLTKLLPMAAVCALALTVGCSDDDDTTKPPEEFDPPANLTFSNNELFGRIDLTWQASDNEGDGDFEGYNIYQSTTSLAGMTGAEADSFKVAGSPFPPSSHSRSITVDPGVRYFFNVRAVKDNGDLSEPSNQVDTALPETGPQIGIVEFADNSGNSGVDLSEGVSYSVMITNLEHIDFFLGTLDDQNDPGDALALKSPSTLLGDNEEQWATRQALFKVLDDPNASSTPSTGFSNSIEISDVLVGKKAVAVQLPRDENEEIHYGKLDAFAFGGEPGNRTVTFLWTYQPVPNYIRF